MNPEERLKEGEEDKPGSVTIDSGTVTGATYHPYLPEGENGCFEDIYHTSGRIEYEPDDGCTSSACNSESSSSFGSGSVANHSVDFRLHLGATTNGASAGLLWLEADTPSSSLWLPTLLRVPFARPGVEVILALDGSVRQVKVPQGLVNIIASSYQYSLQCFYATQVVSKVNGLYTTSGSPFVTWIVSNPDGGAASNRLRVLEQRGGNERVFEYTYTAGNSQWDLLKPDGQTLSTWKEGAPAGSAVTNYFEQVSYAGQVVRKVRNTYMYIPALNGKVLTQVLEGDGQVSRTTTYEYYTSGTGINQVKWIDYPEGNWVYYTYDESGRKLKEYSAYNNSARPTAEPDPLVDHCREIEYTYDTHPTIPTSTSVRLPVEGQSGWELHEVSSKYADVTMYGFTGYGFQDLDDAVPNYETISQSMDPGVYLTTTTYWSRMGDSSAGRPLQVFHPDQTVTTYSYPDEFTTIQTGPDGTETTNIVDELGHPMSSTRIDLATGVVLSQQLYTYTNSAGEYYDPLRRSYDVTDLAGRTTQYRYQDCCGVYSVTDPDGSVVTYDYDTLKRQVAATRYYGSGNGIKTTNVLDAVGRVLQTKRIDTDGSTNILVLSQSQYDLLGRTTRQTNALNGVTTITNVVIDHQLYVTNTYPDGGTRVEAYYRDGRLQSITGTAVFPVKYLYSIEEDSDTSYWRE